MATTTRYYYGFLYSRLFCMRTITHKLLSARRDCSLKSPGYGREARLWCLHLRYLHETKEPQRVRKDLIFCQKVSILVFCRCSSLKEEKGTHMQKVRLYMRYLLVRTHTYLGDSSTFCFTKIRQRVNRNPCQLMLDGMQNNGPRLKMYNFVLH